MPIPTPQYFGIDLDEFNRENADGSVVEYRSACVFVKRIAEKRRRIKGCFEKVISPSPPPPPPADGLESAQWAVEQEENRRINGDDAIYSEGSKDEGQLYVDEVKGSISETRAIIDQLGNNNPILREFLGQAIGEMESSIVRVSDGTVKASDYYGRRLMQRQFEYSAYMSDVLVDHPLMTGFKEGLPGIDRAGCQALCEGVSVTSNRTDNTECRALAFRRADPTSTTDFTGRCYLLTSAGACKAEDFASQLYTRHIQSEEVCHEFPSAYDNPLCIELPTTRTDTRVLTHADATVIAAQTPSPSAPGAGGLPMPRTTIEAGFFVALARREVRFLPPLCFACPSSQTDPARSYASRLIREYSPFGPLRLILQTET